MKKKERQRICRFAIALTQEENDLLQSRFKATTLKALSQYVRAVLFRTPVIARYHNCSLDEFVTLAGGIQGQLDAIRRKFAQAVEILQKQQTTETLTALLSAQSEVEKTIDEIKFFLVKTYEDARHDQTLYGIGKSPQL